jgi:hypothetical protein
VAPASAFVAALCVAVLAVVTNWATALPIQGWLNSAVVLWPTAGGLALLGGVLAAFAARSAPEQPAGAASTVMVSR